MMQSKAPLVSHIGRSDGFFVDKAISKTCLQITVAPAHIPLPTAVFFYSSFFPQQFFNTVDAKMVCFAFMPA